VKVDSHVYETLLHVDERDGLPMFTITSLQNLEPTPPSAPYVRATLDGLGEEFGWTADERVHYCVRPASPGVELGEPRPAPESSLTRFTVSRLRSGDSNGRDGRVCTGFDEVDNPGTRLARLVSCTTAEERRTGGPAMSTETAYGQSDVIPRFLTADERRMLDEVETARGGQQLQDIHAVLKRYRDEGPVAGVDILATLGGRTVLSVRPPEFASFTVVGYDAAVEVLRDHERFSSAGVAKELGAAYGRTILTTDPPEHRAMRKTVRNSFGRRYFDELAASLVKPVVDAYADALAGRGHADLYRDMMISFPVTVLHRWMGLPSDETTTTRFHQLALKLLMLRSDDPSIALNASAELGELFAKSIEDSRQALRRGAARTGLISEVVAANDEAGGVMDDEELVSFCRLMLPAGAETTSKAAGTMIAAMLNQPDVWATLREDPGLVEAAVDETLRWDSPAVAGNYRVATVDTEIAGVPIPAGSGVHVVINAANRDPARFPDPDTFRLDRNAKAQLGFGYGIHLCLGRELARVEMITVLQTLLAKFPGLRRDPDHPAPRIVGLTFRWPDHLHSRWD
jgi:cytochrome P450